MKKDPIYDRLNKLAAQRVLVLDGATGTVIQEQFPLTEADFRGEMFKDHPVSLHGNWDLLSLTRPDVNEAVHICYLEAGADIIETNTFNANVESQSQYKTSAHVYDMNLEAAKTARHVCDRFTKKTPEKPRFVAGSIGPTGKTASVAVSMDDRSSRSVTFDQLVAAYRPQIAGLVDGGVDILLIETIFDVLNAKAAIFAISEVFESSDRPYLPVMVSATINDASGRTLSGMTVEAFAAAVLHIEPWSVGLNCSLGALEMKSHLERLAKFAPTAVHCYPNAGMPVDGKYLQTPELMAEAISDLVSGGMVNIVGGCCGTSPEHISKIVSAIVGMPPRAFVRDRDAMVLSGLEALSIPRGKHLLVNIGERCNVAGSQIFAKHIHAQNFDRALLIARRQVEAGAQIIDVSMDDGMLDGKLEMRRFVNLLMSEPEISRVPLCIDSSDFSVIEEGLKCCQGRALVNSISLKTGEEVFGQQARLLKRYGAVPIVMAFDEEGQAVLRDHKVRISTRAAKILEEEVGFSQCDIAFDTNVLTIATGLPEHDNYAVEFLEAISEIKKLLPAAKTVGGLSNLSFAFRGNNQLREAMHSVFLYLAIPRGLDLAIVNAAKLVPYDSIRPELRTLIEDVIMNTRSDARESLSDVAVSFETDETAVGKDSRSVVRENIPVEERLVHAIVSGSDEFLQKDLDEALQLERYDGAALRLVDRVLMEGMNVVGQRFGEGKLFLPQVLKSAHVMQHAVQFLQSVIADQEAASDRKMQQLKMVLATVRGDIHDIGKNILSTVLHCNNFDVVDIGVNVAASDIIAAVRSHQPDCLGLSGLITPSLSEMANVIREMDRAGMRIPVFVGGAATSATHTAVKLAPLYPGVVVRVPDASKAAAVASSLLSPRDSDAARRDIFAGQAKLRMTHNQAEKRRTLVSLMEARARGPSFSYDPIVPRFPGISVHSPSVEDIRRFLDWESFLRHDFNLHGSGDTRTYPALLSDRIVGGEAKKVVADAESILARIGSEEVLKLRAVLGIFPAQRVSDDIIIFANEEDREKWKDGDAPLAVLHGLRQQEIKEGRESCLCVSDFVAPFGCKDWIGCFCATSGIGLDSLLDSCTNDPYCDVLTKGVANMCAEAISAWLVEVVLGEKWTGNGIRPAVGFQQQPDHSEKITLLEVLNAKDSIGVSLVGSGLSLSPSSSVCALFLPHKEAKYFAVGRISKEQVADYARRKGVSVGEAENALDSCLGYERSN